VRIQDLNWMQLEQYLKGDDRIVVPLGCTEQHAYLSLATDSILAERVAVEAAEPLGVPVLPALPYGLTPSFAAYPGSPSLREDTYAAMLRDLLDSLHGQGFRRVLFVNGHGGNTPGAAAAENWQASRPGAQVLFHDWWNAPGVWKVVESIDPLASHASWLENFPWTRLTGVELPDEQKPLQDFAAMRALDPADVRRMLGDGSFGGRYQKPDEDMLRVWAAGVDEVRSVLEHGFR
jgi:creatinine amidohydrolase